MSTDTFRQLLTEVGSLLPFQEVVEFEEGPSWLAAFEEETFVVLDWLDEPRRVVLHADIGMLASEEKARLAMLERIARYNAAWRETGSLRIGLDPDGTLTLLLDLPQAGLDAAWLCGVLR
ncbi:MAG: type III secretion system chaperone, partial [Alphaproteobacteria bacterium]|nr:type III secretion system chaperone [Alphaproteobacteria bacterium]